MPYYRICPHCGGHLDPGERCDCTEAPSAGAIQEKEKDAPTACEAWGRPCVNTRRSGLQPPLYDTRLQRSSALVGKTI